MDLPKTMRALQLRDVGRLEEVQLPVPRPAGGELLVHTATAVICTTDLNDIKANPFGVALPRVLGHEGAGYVSAVGAGVAGFAEGDLVAAHPVMPCGECIDCRRGLGHLCSYMGHLGYDRDGTYAEYFCIRADRARKVPEPMEAHVAALLEPVAVSLEALRQARVTEGDNLIIIGDGPFGVMIARLASSLRLNKTIIVGHHEFRLDHAPQAVPINSSVVDDPLSSIEAAVEGGSVNAAILAVGSESAVDLGIRSLGAGGRLVVFSPIHQPVRVDLLAVHVRELEIVGACNDMDLIDDALAHLADPALGIGDLVTHRVPFDDWQTAFDLANHRRGSALKVAIVIATGAG